MTQSLITLAGLAVCGAAHGEAPALPARPNILFIVVDDLNDEVGFLGDTHAITPNMDRLAAQSAVFENAHCPALKVARPRSSPTVPSDNQTGVQPDLLRAVSP